MHTEIIGLEPGQGFLRRLLENIGTPILALQHALDLGMQIVNVGDQGGDFFGLYHERLMERLHNRFEAYEENGVSQSVTSG